MQRYLNELPASGRKADLVVVVVLRHQIQHDAAALKDTDGLAILEFVRDCRDAAIWVNLEEPWLFLSVLRELDLCHLVRQAGAHEYKYAAQLCPRYVLW